MFRLCGMSLLNKRRPRMTAAPDAGKINKRRGAYSSKYGNSVDFLLCKSRSG